VRPWHFVSEISIAEREEMQFSNAADLTWFYDAHITPHNTLGLKNCITKILKGFTEIIE